MPRMDSLMNIKEHDLKVIKDFESEVKMALNNPRTTILPGFVPISKPTAMNRASIMPTMTLANKASVMPRASRNQQLVKGFNTMHTAVEAKPASRLSGAGLPMPEDLPLPGGILMVKIVAGKLLRDTEFIGKMDPFVIIEIDGC
jgi:hypothetical protein